VQELFEARNPKGESIIADIDGRVELLTTEDGGRILKVIFSEMREDAYDIPGNWAIQVEDGEDIPRARGWPSAAKGSAVRAQRQSCARRQQGRRPLGIPRRARIRGSIGGSAARRNGEVVVAGQQLTEGSQNPTASCASWDGQRPRFTWSKRCSESTGRRVYPSTTSTSSSSYAR